MSSHLVPEPSPLGWRLDHSYARLPSQFYSRVQPTPVAKPQLVLFNKALACSLGLDASTLSLPESAALFSGNQLPTGADPIAQAYAGHQFGNLTRLGDGRAILLGEQMTPSGERWDIQLKGPGPTPYSRQGDGRAALGPMLREYLISEAMQALGIPTTRSLAVVSTGEPVFRQKTLPGAVLTRVAASHIRVGSFVLFAALDDRESLRILTDYTLQRHFPHLGKLESQQGLSGDSTTNPVLGLLEAIIETQSSLIAHWMRVGFVHGVMNTDNMALSGETIDYGPCAFIDTYDPDAVFSSIDHQGRYAFGNQPQIAAWNLARFAEALLPLLHPEPDQALALARRTLDTFPLRFEQHRLTLMRAKLGLFTEDPTHINLIDDLLHWMQSTRADFTHTFRTLDPKLLANGSAQNLADPVFLAWHQRWTIALAHQPQTSRAVEALMHANNPAVIPRNYQVELALADATLHHDLTRFNRLLAAVTRPYEESNQPPEFINPPPLGTPHCPTFCGT